MKKLVIFTLLLALISSCAVSCKKAKKNEDPTCDHPGCDGNHTDDSNENGDTSGNFYLTGIVKAVNRNIEIDVINSDYAFGIYWVLISQDTIICDANGNRIFLNDIKPGDTVEIVYGGQVMMSYPPQISARKVIKK